MDSSPQQLAPSPPTVNRSLPFRVHNRRLTIAHQPLRVDRQILRREPVSVLAHERRKGEDVGAELPLLGTGGRGLRDKTRGVSREEGSGITSTSRNTSTGTSAPR